MPDIKNDLKNIEGTVEEVIFRSERDGYAVLDLDSGGECITVVGYLGNVEEGEELRLTGRYTTHRSYGLQFKAETCERKLPETAEAIRKYLASGVIKGIGETLSRKLVEEFGDKTLDVIEKEPRRLTVIKGISADKADEINQAFKKVSGVRSLMIFLSEHGIQPVIAVAAWKRWGQFAADQIKRDPYILCGSGIGLEFSKAEKLAAEMDIPPENPGRIKAGITYILATEASGHGNTCLPAELLRQYALKLLGVSEELYTQYLAECTEDEDIFEYETARGNFIFLADYYNAEQYISTRLSVMNDCFKDTCTDYSKLIDIAEKTKGITYAGKQREAIALALSKGFLILTGGPGTGKTTALNAIISLYEQRNMSVMIAAPTGRAAKRISELTGYPAKTIHRVLEVAYDSSGQPKFRHNESDPLDCDVMIIDEMSMVDTLLFEALLRAMKLSCRLIMVGDSDQLPSVGAGNILKDMTDSGRLTVVELSEIFRQAEESLIVTNAHRIVKGGEPELLRRDGDFFFMQRFTAEETAETAVDLCARRLPESYKYSPIDDIQVLCPSRKGPAGTEKVNMALQERLNPPGKGLAEFKGAVFTFRDGDKVMQTKNNYEIVWKKGGENGTGIFNGDIGTIVKVKKNDRTVVVNFDGKIAEYPFEITDQLELAYAITVHKSQGSEFNAVILALADGFDLLYYRNLLYTAVTRAKKMIVIVGTKRLVMKMVRNNRRTMRYTCLRDMIEKELG